MNNRGGPAKLPMGSDVIAEFVRNYYEKTGKLLKQSELAEMLGVKQPAVSRWLGGEREIPETVKLLIKKLSE